MKSLLVAATLAGAVIATAAYADPQGQGHERGHGRQQATAGCTQAGAHGGGQQRMAEQHARMQAQMQAHMQGEHGRHGRHGDGPQAGRGPGSENCPMQNAPRAS